MTTATTIMHLEREGRTGLCGDVLVPTTTRVADVTCRRCLHRMELARRAPDAPFVPGPAIETTRGTWKLDELGVGTRAIRSSRAGEGMDDGPRWSSLRKAAEQCSRVLDDGAPIRSTFRSEAPVQNSGSAAGAFGGREDVLAFVRALEGAFTKPRAFGEVEISAWHCRVILEARLCGVPRRELVQRGRKGLITRRSPISATEIARELSDAMKVEITEHQVGLVFRDGCRAMRRSLERAGMLRPPRRRDHQEDGEMPKAPTGWDKDTWTEIAEVVGLHEDTCRKLAKRPNDPLPVSEYFGRIVAKSSELEEWMQRQVQPKARTSGAA